MSLFAPVRSPKLPCYITVLILLLNLHFPLNSHCSQYSVKQPVLDNRRRSVQSAPTPNYFREGGGGGGGEEDGGVTISSVGYEESLPSEYNVHESRESGKSYEYPGSEEMELPAAALETTGQDLAESAHLRQKRPKTQRELLLEELFSNYKTHERPTEMLETPTVVKVNMKVLAIFSVDVRTMDYYMDALLRQTWIDPRLAWNTTAGFGNYTQPLVAPSLKEMLWLPDLFFRNGKDGYLHKMTLPNYLLRVYPDGSVLYSQKITMRFACQMDLQTFPMDTQRCDINIGSYGYTLSELKFVWRETAAVELPEKLQISEFNTPKNFTTLDCTSVANTSTGSYTCLLAKFTLQRQLGSYLVTTYIPNILIIMVSFLSFWVNVDAAPARVPLGLLSLLGLLTQASSMTTSLPRVSYIKALDLWLIFSIIFVICVLVEYAFAITMLRRKRKAIWRMDVRQIVREELVRWSAACQKHAAKGSDVPRGQSDFYTEVESFLCINNEQEKKKKTAKTTKGGREPPESEIDSYSRFIFPLCYIMYNMFYWLYYLVIVKQTEDPD
ncbi:Glycine receptor subunit alpha-3 [Sparganum proliferum]